MTEVYTKEFLAECFDYVHGEIFWKERPVSHFQNKNTQKVFNSRQAGKLAGRIVSGYILVNLKQKRISAHRIVFLMHHGFLPEQVDHINGDPLDNRIENLRAATKKQNMRNMKTSKANTSGRKGVSIAKTTGKFVAYIRKDGKMKHLGCFDSLEAASECRRKAEIEIYGEFANER